MASTNPTPDKISPAHDNDGPMILAHDEVAGYRPVFYVCIGLGILYLAFVFWQTW